MLATAMREIFPEAKVHPSIGEKIANYRKEQVAQVKALIAANRVVVVGMTQNRSPSGRVACSIAKALPTNTWVLAAT
ncbi:MAG: hypothetical protein WDO74_30230 [Pseudomonadota bacterium]